MSQSLRAWVVVALLVAAAGSACNRDAPPQAVSAADREQLAADRKHLQADRAAVEEEKRKVQADREQLAAERKQFEAERRAAPTRPLAEALLGSWSATDPESDLRGVTFAKDQSATVAYASNGNDPQVRPAKYELVGSAVKLTVLVDGSFTGLSRITFDMQLDVVRATDGGLVVRRDRLKGGQVVAKAREERLVRK